VDGSARPVSAYQQSSNQNASTTAKTQFSYFTKTERATTAHPNQKFYTTNKDVTSITQNKFEGKSNYNNYYPSDSLQEQKMEKIWQEAKNRQLTEKRRNEEGNEIMRGWSSAKGRLEGEIQRKKEQIANGSNFEKARAFNRRNWSSRGFNPHQNPLNELSSDSEEFDEAEYGEEELDIIQDDGEEEEREDESMGLDQSEQKSDSQQSKRMRAKSAYPTKKKSPERKVTLVHDLTKD